MIIDNTEIKITEIYKPRHQERANAVNESKVFLYNNEQRITL